MSKALMSIQDRHALSFWDLGTALSAAVPASGTVNRTVLLQTSAGAFVLRISCRESWRVAWEHECIAWAADHGLPVCRPIPLPGGGTILERSGVFYALFPFALGRQVMRTELSTEHARAAGSCLARIHIAFQTFPAERTRTKNLSVDHSAALASIPNIEDAIQALPTHTETEEAALEQLAGRRAWLEQTSHLTEGLQGRLAVLPQAVLHGDYQETNLFFEDGAVSAVIDWDQSGRAARGWEVVRALHLMLALSPELCRSFLDSYRGVFPLAEDELQGAAACYGVLADSNLWVYQAAYLESNERANRFIGSGPFVPFQVQWEQARLNKPLRCEP